MRGEKKDIWDITAIILPWVTSLIFGGLAALLTYQSVQISNSQREIAALQTEVARYQALSTLIMDLGSDNPVIQRLSATALTQFGSVAIHPLMSIAADKDLAVRTAVCHSLELFGKEGYADEILSLLDSFSKPLDATTNAYLEYISLLSWFAGTDIYLADAAVCGLSPLLRDDPRIFDRILDYLETLHPISRYVIIRKLISSLENPVLIDSLACKIEQSEDKFVRSALYFWERGLFACSQGSARTLSLFEYAISRLAPTPYDLFEQTVERWDFSGISDEVPEVIARIQKAGNNRPLEELLWYLGQTIIFADKTKGDLASAVLQLAAAEALRNENYDVLRTTLSIASGVGGSESSWTGQDIEFVLIGDFFIRGAPCAGLDGLRKNALISQEVYSRFSNDLACDLQLQPKD